MVNVARSLRLSKSASFYRKTAVALVRDFPGVAEALRAGELCLMTVAEVARVLTRENRAEVLPRFFGLSKREAKELAATLLPREDPPLRAVVTPVRAPSLAPALDLPIPPAPVAGSVAAPVLPVERPAAFGAAAPVARRTAAPESSPPIVEPLTAELRRLHVTVTDRFLRKLDAVRAALSHSYPAATAEELLELGLDLLLERHEKRKGLMKKPREVPRPSTNPDHVPAHARKASTLARGIRSESA
ncbi:MAG TPA: hypothetical protein VFL83_08790 [Anaeromyxobacter sp.]|nr:hypothetical protein [Anaeromyxobacter sp.]